ncbi:MAG TPA: hypothetical protein VFA22_07230 [Stellaceae bacterium]|nr:hypothetical protein [Stellaceae bacterium]
MTDTPTNATASTGNANTGVSGSASGGNVGDSLAQAAASLAAVATSLTENMAKLSSITENIAKVQSGLNTQENVTAAHGIDTATTAAEHISGVKGSEGITDHVVRTLQDYSGDSLESVRRSRVWFDKIVNDVLVHDNDVRAVITRALSNAVETDNLVGKQAVRHADLQITEQLMAQEPEVGAITSQANVDNSVWAAAIQAMAKAFAQTMATPTATPGATKSG